MRKLIIILIGFVFVIGCSQKRPKVSTTEFNLRKDLFQFSEKMNNGDTLFLNAMLGVCISNCMEFNTIIKINDSVYIQSEIVNIYPNENSKTLEKTQYKFLINDTLNFENLFYSLKDMETNINNNSDYIFQVKFKKETIEFRGKGLASIIRKLSYYDKIKQRIYPFEEIYKPVVGPVKP